MGSYWHSTFFTFTLVISRRQTVLQTSVEHFIEGVYSLAWWDYLSRISWLFVKSTNTAISFTWLKHISAVHYKVSISLSGDVKFAEWLMRSCRNNTKSGARDLMLFWRRRHLSPVFSVKDSLLPNKGNDGPARGRWLRKFLENTCCRRQNTIEIMFLQRTWWHSKHSASDGANKF